MTYLKLISLKHVQKVEDNFYFYSNYSFLLELTDFELKDYKTYLIKHNENELLEVAEFEI